MWRLCAVTLVPWGEAASRGGKMESVGDTWRWTATSPYAEVCFLSKLTFHLTVSAVCARADTPTRDYQSKYKFKLLPQAFENIFKGRMMCGNRTGEKEKEKEKACTETNNRVLRMSCQRFIRWKTKKSDSYLHPEDCDGAPSSGLQGNDTDAQIGA